MLLRVPRSKWDSSLRMPDLPDLVLHRGLPHIHTEQHSYTTAPVLVSRKQRCCCWCDDFPSHARADRLFLSQQLQNKQGSIWPLLPVSKAPPLCLSLSFSASALHRAGLRSLRLTRCQLPPNISEFTLLPASFCPFLCIQHNADFTKVSGAVGAFSRAHFLYSTTVEMHRKQRIELL